MLTTDVRIVMTSSTGYAQAGQRAGLGRDCERDDGIRSEPHKQDNRVDRVRALCGAGTRTRARARARVCVTRALELLPNFKMLVCLCCLHYARPARPACAHCQADDERAWG